MLDDEWRLQDLLRTIGVPSAIPITLLSPLSIRSEGIPARLRYCFAMERVSDSTTLVRSRRLSADVNSYGKSSMRP